MPPEGAEPASSQWKWSNAVGKWKKKETNGYESKRNINNDKRQHFCLLLTGGSVTSDGGLADRSSR